VSQPSDLEALKSLEVACFPDPWSERALTEALINENYLVLIERDEAGTPLGYLLGWQVGDEAELARIGVAIPVRRSGKAKSLLDNALARWRERGVSRVFLEVRENNVAARRLYESRGFQAVGKRAKYYADGADAIVLSLEM
jgi:ribosomal-protein-alanine N-acetyltransferase